MPPETDKRLTDRRALILRAIVSHYVGTGEPVGSKVLVERYRLGVSPATVRNEMSALEDAGYIYQPHTSAGRIPTDAGYRYFVDEMPEGARLPAAEAHRIRQFLSRRAGSSKRPCPRPPRCCPRARTMPRASS